MTGPLVRPGEGLPASEGADDAQRLRELGERYFWLFEDSPVAKYVCDVEGTVLEVNAALCRMLCMRPDDLVGRTWPASPSTRPAAASWSRSFAAPCGRTRESGRTARPTVGRGGRPSPWGDKGRKWRRSHHIRRARRPDRPRAGFVRARPPAPPFGDGHRGSNIAVWELDVVSGRVTVQDRPPGAGAFREQNMTYGDFVRTFHPTIATSCQHQDVAVARPHRAGP